jgi:GNAT superfamily N-acetyltransferase
MYRLKKFELSDYEELVDMFYEFTKECYPERKIGLKYRFYERVNQWIDNKYDIILGAKDDKIVGFSMAYIDNSGLTENVYVGEIAYVKPEFRKGRITYMLYSNVVQYAKELGLTLVSNSRISNGVDNMIKKHYDVEEKYTQFELRR